MGGLGGKVFVSDVGGNRVPKKARPKILVANPDEILKQGEIFHSSQNLRPIHTHTEAAQAGNTPRLSWLSMKGPPTRVLCAIFGASGFAAKSFKRCRIADRLCRGRPRISIRKKDRASSVTLLPSLSPLGYEQFPTFLARRS